MKKFYPEWNVWLRLFFLGMMVIPAFHSCVMEKRVYLPGYQVTYERKTPKLQQHESKSLLINGSQEQKQSEANVENDLEISAVVPGDSRTDAFLMASVDPEGIEWIPEKMNPGQLFSTLPLDGSAGSVIAVAPQRAMTQQQGYAFTKAADPDYGKMAKAGFMLGLNGLLASGPMAFLVSWALCVAGAVLCSIVLKEKIFNTLTRKQKGYAIAGLILSVMGFIICAFWIILMIVG